MARTFGERFVEEFERAGGTTAGWDAARRATLLRADRRAFIAAMERVNSGWAKELLIAAHTAEQIARRISFRPEAINQIKTAVVEACINATEHSLSPDRKIYQRFRVESDKLIVTIASRGVVVPLSESDHGEGADEVAPGSDATRTKQKRGWGLQLIRTLMDEVEFESVDDGTRLRMTKYVRK